MKSVIQDLLMIAGGDSAEFQLTIQDRTAVDADVRFKRERSDWRFHIAKGLRELWPKLSEETRLAIYIQAESRSRNFD